MRDYIFNIDTFRKKVFLVVIAGLFLNVILPGESWATISYPNFLQNIHGGYCAQGNSLRIPVNSFPPGSVNIGGSDMHCTMNLEGYVPRSGNYSVGFYVYEDGNQSNFQFAESSKVYISTDSSLNAESLYVTSERQPLTIINDNVEAIRSCYVLIDDAGKKYSVDGCPFGSEPLPPTPPPPEISCAINNGNALTVDLETNERTELPTVPGAGAGIKNYSIPVTCTGGDTGMTIPVVMSVKYTPISIGGIDTVQSSSNGLGVAIIHEGNPLTLASSTPITLGMGANTLDLGFQAIRDPAVPVADVPTGAFNASASLIMTQQ